MAEAITRSVEGIAPPFSMCGDPSDEMDHRLAIEVTRALGPAAMLRAFTPDNLRWLCRDFHRRKTRQGRRLAKFLSAVGCPV